MMRILHHLNWIRMALMLRFWPGKRREEKVENKNQDAFVIDRLVYNHGGIKWNDPYN